MLLSETSLRNTRQRRIILEEVRKSASHPTADEVCTMVRKRLPRISLGTVYRNLEMMSESGLIRKLEFIGTQNRYDANMHHHYHVLCTKCGRVDDVPFSADLDIEGTFQGAGGYRITGHQLVLTGLCPRCQQVEAQKTAKKER